MSMSYNDILASMPMTGVMISSPTSLTSPNSIGQRHSPYASMSSTNANFYGSNVNRLKSVFFTNENYESPKVASSPPPVPPKNFSKIVNIGAKTNEPKQQGVVLPINNLSGSSHVATPASISPPGSGGRSRSLSTPRSNNANPSNNNGLLTTANPNHLSSKIVFRQQNLNQQEKPFNNQQMNQRSPSSPHSSSATMNSNLIVSTDHLTRFQSAKALFARMEEESARLKMQINENNQNPRKNVVLKPTIPNRRSLSHTGTSNFEPNSNKTTSNKRLTMASTNDVHNSNDFVHFIDKSDETRKR